LFVVDVLVVVVVVVAVVVNPDVDVDGDVDVVVVVTVLCVFVLFDRPPFAASITLLVSARTLSELPAQALTIDASTIADTVPVKFVSTL
jgi:hypothetical protein